MSTPRSLSSRVPVLTKRMPVWMILGSALLGATPLGAQAVQQVGVTGHVAPRCWTLLPGPTDQLLATTDSNTRHSVAARCNHPATPVSMHWRRLPATPRQIAVTRGETTETPSAPEDNPASRTAIEIVLSPTL